MHDVWGGKARAYARLDVVPVVLDTALVGSVLAQIGDLSAMGTPQQVRPLAVAIAVALALAVAVALTLALALPLPLTPTPPQVNMQLALFEECSLDDESGKCKQL